MLPLLVLCGRLWLDARRELAFADASSFGDPASVHTRVIGLGRAARAWLPTGASQTARAELAVLGRAGADGAWPELRASILATRWLFTPDPALLDEANHALAEQRARRALDAGDKAAVAEAAVRAQTAVELRLLEQSREPSRPLCVLAVVGLAAFLYGTARALGGRPRHALLGAAGFAMLVTGLAWA